MTYRCALSVLLCVLAVTLPGVTPRAVSACSGGGFEGGYRERIKEMYSARYVQAVTLAEITDIGLLEPTGGLYFGTNKQMFVLPPGAMRATFQPYVWWSREPLTGNTIAPLHRISSDCSGGPKFEHGDRVLLFLTGPRWPVSDYSIGAFGDTIIFRGDSAYFVYAWGYTEPAGSTREVIDYLFSIAGSPDYDSWPAREFVGLPPAP